VVYESFLGDLCEMGFVWVLMCDWFRARPQTAYQYDDGYEQAYEKPKTADPKKASKGNAKNRPKTGRGRRVDPDPTNLEAHVDSKFIAEPTQGDDWDLENIMGIVATPVNNDTAVTTDSAPLEESQHEASESTAYQSQDTHYDNTDDNKQNQVDQPLEGEASQVPSENVNNPDQTNPEGTTEENKPEEVPETPEERQKREEQEKREADIIALEEQIREQEALLFDWDDLESAMIKQRFIDGLKEELA
jgi:hypothetical protein